MWTAGSRRGFGSKRVRGRRREPDEGDVLLKAGGMHGMRERERAGRWISRWQRKERESPIFLFTIVRNMHDRDAVSSLPLQTNQPTTAISLFLQEPFFDNRTRSSYSYHTIPYHYTYLFPLPSLPMSFQLVSKAIGTYLSLLFTTPSNSLR